MAPEPAAHSRSNVDAMLYLPAPSWKSGIYRRVVDAEVVDEPSLSQLNEGFRLQWRRRRRRSSNNGARGTGGRRSQKTKPLVKDARSPAPTSTLLVCHPPAVTDETMDGQYR